MGGPGRSARQGRGLAVSELRERDGCLRGFGLGRGVGLRERSSERVETRLAIYGGGLRVNKREMGAGLLVRGEKRREWAWAVAWAEAEKERKGEGRGKGRLGRLLGQRRRKGEAGPESRPAGPEWREKDFSFLFCFSISKPH